VTQNDGRAIGENELELSIPDLGIQKIEPSRVDLDEDIVIPERRLRHVGEAQGALFLVSIEDEGFHAFLLSAVLLTRVP
jgi:hypothetical protein